MNFDVWIASDGKVLVDLLSAVLVLPISNSSTHGKLSIDSASDHQMTRGSYSRRLSFIGGLVIGGKWDDLLVFSNDTS